MPGPDDGGVVVGSGVVLGESVVGSALGAGVVGAEVGLFVGSVVVISGQPAHVLMQNFDRRVSLDAQLENWLLHELAASRSIADSQSTRWRL